MNFPGDALAESGCTGVCRFSFSYGPVTSPGFSRASRFLAERMGVNNQRCTGPGMGGQARRPRSSCGQPCLRPHSPYACSPMPGELWRGRDNDGRLPGSKICRLTTFLFGVSDRTDFHVQTFFSLQNRQRGNLCGMHKFLRCIIVYHRMSQSSDSKGQRFESPRPQQAVPFWVLSFLFCIQFYGMLRGRIRTAAKATAACGGSREPKQGPRSQRASPAQGGAARCGHRNPYSARRPASRRAKKPLRGFFRVRLGESPRRQRAVLFGHCSFLFDHKNSSAGRGHNGRGARCKKHKIIFSCANTNWPVSVQGDIQSPGPGALPEV